MIKDFKSYRKVFTLTLAFFTVMLILFSVNSSDTKPYSVKLEDGYLKSYYASALSYANQCGHLYAYEDYDKISYAVPDGYFNDIPSGKDIVPMYGYIAKSYLPRDKIGFYSPETINRNWSESYILSTMWNLDVVVIWYDEEKITDKELNELKETADAYPNQLLILPWLHYESETLPVQRKFAFARMGASQSCNKYNFNVLIDFLSFLKQKDMGAHSPTAQTAVLEEGNLIELPIDKSTGK